MVVHTALVTSWGFEPCERFILSSTSFGLSGRGAVPRPPGAGRGNPEVQTLLNRTPSAYGGQYLAGRLYGVPHEQKPSPAAASFLFSVLVVDFQGNRCDRTVGTSRHEASFIARVNGDLGTATL